MISTLWPLVATSPGSVLSGVEFGGTGSLVSQILRVVLPRIFRVARASRALVSASRRNNLFGKSAKAGTPSPTRETRALPGSLRSQKRRLLGMTAGED